MSGFMLSQQLRAALKREVVNDHALLEMLQQVLWQFKTGAVADALSAATEEIDDLLSITEPTPADLRDLAVARKFEQLEAA